MNVEPLVSDEHLVQLAQNGQKNAYNVLLGRYNQKIQHIMYLYTGDHANAHDLTQEVLLKVYRYLKDFKEDSRFSTWLYKITQNTIKNHFRSLSQRIDSETQFANEYVMPINHSPEHQLINIEFGEQIESALLRLSDELRVCYGRHIFDGKTYEDIAKEMNCPIGTVRSRIFRARKLLMSFVRQ